MGSIVSAIGGGINAIISAIAGVIETIVSVIVSIIVAIWDFFVAIICCRCGSRSRRGGGMSSTRTSGRRGWGRRRAGGTY
ncbi:hypothetical protein K466DRAFT_586794 [Polyporus arcularius HHB13444]|uniref:Uncharacterized protein n=1 Tax=Polyporus arcularius HHB13444 TaxID=1314778 RepID=A0A5C3PEE0_9APHY|nr:hypothetical protein K466DRAFT_586794 [Polyporus arcularius HHB13444]